MIFLHNKKLTLNILLILVFFVSCSEVRKEKLLTDFVDPYIGSDYHGHVFVGANVPFGLVQLGPCNIVKGWDWCSGYHYSDSILAGFAHTHLSGTGIGDLGDILFMPVNNTYKLQKNSSDSVDWKSTYSHNAESAKPNYYSVHINRYNIDADLTASERVGFHKYTYHEKGNPSLIVDMNYGIGWDKLTTCTLKQIDNYTIAGSRFSKGWANDQRIFFTSTFSKKIKSIEYLQRKDEKGNTTDDKVTALIKFEGENNLLAKTAISPVNIDGAKNNMQQEIPGWNFDEIYNAGIQKWNDELGKIKITTNKLSDKKTFYTALYHTMIVPALYNDANGDYLGTDKKIHKNPGYNTYTTFSLWDTYRAAHPLYTLVDPDKVSDFVNTMLAIYQQQGKLPVWHLMGCETDCMVGYHAAPVIVDAYLKGIKGFDPELAFEAIKTTAMQDFRGIGYVMERGYIPADSQVESVARGLEYAIDDWCIAAMAGKMGKTEDAEYFKKRSKYYQNYFDKENRFMRGRMGDGSWRTPFDPISSQHQQDDFCEGNAWQYTWLVPQSPEDLIKLFDGEENFTRKLDSLFSIESIKVEGASSDITGLIGQYAHGNEPSHHIAYLYAYVGQQWKTAKMVHQINTTMYTDQPDGLCGNEDCGQMSAWYVLSSMGFYPVNPANGAYVFGSPLFDKVELNVPGGNTFNVIAENRSDKNIYIQSAELNGKPYTKSFITHKQILEGGTLKFVMGDTPNKEFGVAPDDRPKSIVY